MPVPDASGCTGRAGEEERFVPAVHSGEKYPWE